MRERSRSGLIRQSVPWIGGTVALIVGALALFLFTGNPATEAAAVSLEYGTDISHGPPDAKVVLVEYADFECGACAGYAGLLAPLREEYADDVLFVFRFFPLENHPYGMISAQVAYAAHLQGKFWEMHDLLYTNQQEWVESSDPSLYFDAYATLLGLDLDKFHDDVKAESTTDFITRQHSEAAAGGVDHTPWFLLNGTTIQPRDATGFRELIEEQL